MIRFLRKLRSNKGIESGILGLLLVLILTTTIAMEIDFFTTTLAKEHIIMALESTEIYALMASVDYTPMVTSDMGFNSESARLTFENEIHAKLRDGAGTFFHTIYWSDMDIVIESNDTEAYIWVSLDYSPMQFVKSANNSLFPSKSKLQHIGTPKVNVKVASKVYMYKS